MKFGELRSVAHNLADSLASGIGILIGVYEMDIFREASSSLEGFITVDFLAGVALGGRASPGLVRAVELYRDALPGLCQRHGVNPLSFAVLTARYGVDAVHGPHFLVTVEDQMGRRSEDQYVGVPGRRVRRRA